MTGGSGFVGRRLCAMLVDGGHQVVAPVRHEKSRAALPAGVEAPVVESPIESGALAPHMAGVDAVVHLAARVHVMTEASDPIAEFQRVNVEGTRAVVAAARAAGARRFIFVSSIKVNGEGGAAPYTESDPPRPVDPYGQSKLDAERVVREAGGAMGWTIMRPPLVYGPGVGGNFRRLLQLADVAARWPLPLGGMDNLRSMIFVDNLASAVMIAMPHTAAQNRMFLVSDDHDVGVSELLRRLAISLGGRPRLFGAPISLMRQAGAVLGRKADLERLLGTLRVNSSLIQSTLGWRPPVELGDALAVTAGWWRSEKMG